MKQVIVITLELAEGQKPYKLEEQHYNGPYEALKHFFEDIQYKVRDVTISEPFPERPPISS